MGVGIGVNGRKDVGAMPTLVVGMLWIYPHAQHAHDKRGHGAQIIHFQY